jgi:alkanesulfonate monooxygenase SsuD/methylene tetrahydromethanopterin reductase-like flavin-dependent oxidoreductase (luciferase family)
MAASPSVFLAAVAQRTQRLKFGPLVYTLPLYHPLRLVEEICMLDQMSGGRFLLGIGKGISPLETAAFGIDPAERQRRFEETLSILVQGLTKPTVDFAGAFFRFKDVPMELAPLQQPHPPIWVGVASGDSAERAARHGYNVVSLSTTADTRVLTDRYRKGWRETRGEAPLPKLGLGRFIVVAPTGAEALALARRAYTSWHASFHHLWRLHGIKPTQGKRPPTFDEMTNGVRGIAGSPASVAEELRTSWRNPAPTTASDSSCSAT